MYRVEWNAGLTRIVILFLLVLVSQTLLAKDRPSGFLDLEPRIEVLQGDWDGATLPESSAQGWTSLAETPFKALDEREFIWLRAELSKAELITKPWLLLHPYIQKVTVFVDGQATTASL
jgi:two-component system, sensor histidine kinase LadS